MLYFANTKCLFHKNKIPLFLATMLCFYERIRTHLGLGELCLGPELKAAFCCALQNLSVAHHEENGVNL